MKRTMVMMILIGFGLASCSPAQPAATAGQNGPDHNSNSTPPATIWTTAPGSLPGGATPASTNPAAMPMAVTVRPPVILIGPGNATPPPSIPTPTPFSISGWSTFTSLALGVAVDYPPGWSVTVQAAGATFVSPQGAAVLLAINPGGESNPASSGCNSLANAYGLTAIVCGDTKTGQYNASFTVRMADGASRQVTLSTTTSAALDAYKGMISSLHTVK